jgi:tetratricopeptide (TPR) repeat protein
MYNGGVGDRKPGAPKHMFRRTAATVAGYDAPHYNHRVISARSLANLKCGRAPAGQSTRHRFITTAVPRFVAHSTECRIVSRTSREVSMRQIVAVVLIASSLGCASSFKLSEAPTAAEISALEASVARNPNDVRGSVRLAHAYVVAKRHADARPILEKVVAAHPENAEASFLLGVSYEELGEFASARKLYRSYIEKGPSKQLRAELQRRLPVLQRKELQAAARQAVANEVALANKPPQPFTVAILPFQFIGSDPQYAPLGRAMAEFLVHDLSQTDRLKVLERAQVQLLLDEMKLGASGAVDPNTAARTGRMLGAERVVQGSMDGGEASLSLETMIVRVREGLWPREAPASADRPNLVALSDRDALNQLIAMQKRLSLRIYSSLGIQLTEAERARVSERPTESLMAVLAYGRGLQAEDAGDYRTATQHFTEAARLDPRFAQARASSQRVTASAQAANVAAEDLTAMAESNTSSGASSQDFFLPNPMARDQVAEILRVEGTSPTFLEIILRRPR